MANCPACGSKIDGVGKFCTNCGADTQARSSPGTAPAQAPVKKKPIGLLNGCLIVLAVFVGLIILLAIIGPTDHNKSTEPTVSESTASNDAALLLSRCGQPSSDDSTEYDNPRPPIPTRIIEYKQKKLRFMFIPGGGSKVGDPPPYQWKLVGITDMTAADPSKARVVNPAEAAVRIPCWSGK